MITTRSIAIRFGVSRSWPIKSAETSTFFYNFDFLLKQFFNDFFLQPAILGTGAALAGVILRRFPTYVGVDVFLQDAHLLEWLSTRPGFTLRKLSKKNVKRLRRKLTLRSKRKAGLVTKSKIGNRVFSFSRRTFHRLRMVDQLRVRRFFRSYSKTRFPVRIKLRRSIRTKKKLSFLRRKKRRFFFAKKLKRATSLLRYISIYKSFKRRRNGRGVRAAEFKLTLRRRRRKQAQYQWHEQRRRKIAQLNRNKKKKFFRFSARKSRVRRPRLFPRPKFIFSKKFFRVFNKFFRFRFFMFASKLGSFLAFKQAGIPLKIRLNFIRKKATAQFYLNYITTKLYYRYILSDVINPIVRLSLRYYRGFRIVCKGRFTRAQMATERVYRRGSLRLSSLQANLDYAQKFVVLKYGACNLKIWLRY